MDKKIKYVTLDITTRLYQEDLNCLIEHLKKLKDFDFLIKSEVYTDTKIQKEEYKKLEKLNARLVSKFLPHSRRVIIPVSLM